MKPKFNFVPERQLNSTDGDVSYRVSLYKNNIVMFGKQTVDIYDLANKFVRLYADSEKKIIGWSVFDKAELTDDLRLMKPADNGSVGISIGKLLKKIGYTVKETTSDIVVNKFVGPLHKEPIYYIKLP